MNPPETPEAPETPGALASLLCRMRLLWIYSGESETRRRRCPVCGRAERVEPDPSGWASGLWTREG